MSKKLHAKLGTFAAIPISLFQDERVKPNAIRVYGSLASYEGTSDYSFPGYVKIAERAGISVRAVSDALNNLIETGWIAKTRRGHGRTNIYRCLVYMEQAELLGQADAPEIDATDEVLIGEKLADHDERETRLYDGRENSLSYDKLSSTSSLEKHNPTSSVGVTVGSPILQLAPPILPVETTPIVKTKDVSSEIAHLVNAFKTLYPSYHHNAKRQKILKQALSWTTCAEFEERIEKLVRLIKSGRDFWVEQPITPEVVLSLWDRILTARTTSGKTTEELYGRFSSQREKDEYEEMMS